MYLSSAKTSACRIAMVLLLLFGMAGLVCWGLPAVASRLSVPPPHASKQKPPSSGRGKRMIILDHADLLQHDQELLPDVIILTGNVRLRHESWIMQCDSANLNEATNSFDAYGHIRITEGDSITITSGELEYDGMYSLAVLRENVILSKGVASLFTEELYYDRNTNTGYYEELGTLVDSLNTLTSVYGEYSTNDNEAFFQYEVHLENDNFTLDTEQLYYNTETSICRIVSPTLIETTDTVTIETDRGFYNTDSEQGILLNRSLVSHPDGTMTGDSILYDKKRQIGEAYYDVIIDNQKDKVIYYGDYGYLDEQNSYVYATGQAYAVDYSEPDSLYMSADVMEGINQKRPPLTGSADSVEITYTKAYHNAKLFRADVQAVADSIHYFSADSLIKLYGTPILWNDSLQLKGDTIHAHIANDTIDHAFAWNHASTVRWISDDKQDRAKSDSIEAYFLEGAIDHAYYISDVESRYYLKQDKTNPRMDVYFLGDQLDRIFWHGKAEGTIHPIQDLKEDLRQMSGAEWHGDKRPAKPQDVIPDRSGSSGIPDSLVSQLAPGIAAEFDGLAAWLAFYQEYQEQEQLHPIFSADSATAAAPTPAADSSASDGSLSVYILRMDASTHRDYSGFIDLHTYSVSILPIYSWHSFFAPKDPDLSTINPSIGMKRENGSTNELRKYDENSKAAESSPAQTLPPPAMDRSESRQKQTESMP